MRDFFSWNFVLISEYSSCFWVWECLFNYLFLVQIWVSLPVSDLVLIYVFCLIRSERCFGVLVVFAHVCMCIYVCIFLVSCDFFNLYDYCWVGFVFFPLIFVWGSLHFVGIYVCLLFGGLIHTSCRNLFGFYVFYFSVCVCLYGLIFAVYFLIDIFMYSFCLDFVVTLFF